MADTQHTLFRIDNRACTDAVFDGRTFDGERDGERLSRALDRVRDLMRDGQWRTIAEVANLCGCSQSGAAARLRDLRKRKFGRHKVPRRQVRPGLFEYRVIY